MNLDNKQTEPKPLKYGRQIWYVFIVAGILLNIYLWSDIVRLLNK